MNLSDRDGTIVVPLGEPWFSFRRWFASTPEQLFEAQIAPHMICRWWGPRALRMSHVISDPRPGGERQFVFVAPDGTEHRFSGEYREIDPAARVVYTERYDAMPASIAEHLISYTPSEGGTIVEMRATYASAESRDVHVQTGMESGMRETWSRLDALLAATPRREDESGHAILLAGALTLIPGERWYAFQQLMSGTPENLAAALVTPELIRQWWGPERITVKSIISELVVGGTRRITFSSGDGPEMAFSGEYLELHMPTTIRYIERFEQMPDGSSMVTETITQTPDGVLLEEFVMFDQAEHRDGAFAMGMESGMRESMRRLAKLVSEMPV